jgi:hypothetical protein
MLTMLLRRACDDHQVLGIAHSVNEQLRAYGDRFPDLLQIIYLPQEAEAEAAAAQRVTGEPV